MRRAVKATREAGVVFARLAESLDEVGAFTAPGDGPVDEAALVAFVQSARAQYPGRTLLVGVTAIVPATQRGAQTEGDKQ